MADLPRDWTKLYSAVVSDSLDAVGLLHQAMSPRIRPLDGSRECADGRTGVLYMETAHVDPGVNPYELEIAIVDDLKPGNVAVSLVVAPRASRRGEACLRPRPSPVAPPAA